MDSFELNKIIAAVLLTALIVIGIGKITDYLFYVEKPKQSAYKIEGIDSEKTDQASKKVSSEVMEKVDIKQLWQWETFLTVKKFSKSAVLATKLQRMEKI